MTRGPLSIDWARTDITPPGKSLLQGQFYARLATAAISPLSATALALETRSPDGAVEQAILLSCDLGQESFKADLLERLDRRCPDLDRQGSRARRSNTRLSAISSGWGTWSLR